jgi:hypothetical protein
MGCKVACGLRKERTNLARRIKPLQADPSTPRSADAPPAPALERHYANHLRVGFNRLEFLLDFAQVYEGSSERVQAQLVAGPAHVKAFAQLIQGCIEDYEALYGAVLADAPAPAADGGA